MLHVLGRVDWIIYAPQRLIKGITSSKSKRKLSYMINLKFSVYVLRHLKVKRQNEPSPTLFFNFYLSLPSRIKKSGTGWEENPWRKAERIHICGERKYDYPEGAELKMNLLNYGSPCVHKMCILLCFIISFFRKHLL